MNMALAKACVISLYIYSKLISLTSVTLGVPLSACQPPGGT